ncbi:MAG: CDP-glycerol glycerophosphotransferase family protein [bacterium]|nr:CDP-glycerol glycerophosphotransferase family protein [bacterium]
MEKLDTIFLGLSTPRDYSEMLRGKCVEHLVEKYHVVALTQKVDTAMAKKFGYLLHKNLEYIVLPLYNKKELAFFDNYLRLPFAREFDHFTATRRFIYRQYKNPEIAKARPLRPLPIRALIQAGRILPKQLPYVSLFTLLERFYIQPSPTFKDLLRTYSPKLMITMTPGFMPFDAELVINAKTFGIPTLATYINVDNTYNKGKFLRKTDYFFTWNTQMKKEVIDFFHYKPNHVFETGCLRFDHYFNDTKENKIRSRKDFLLSKNLDPDKKTVTYFTSTPVGFPWWEPVMNAIMDLKKRGGLEGNPNIIIRIHPVEILKRYTPYGHTPGVHVERGGSIQHLEDHKAPGKHLKVEMNEKDTANLTETLMYSDVVINIFSTTVMEACIFDTPIVCIGFPKGIGEGSLEYEIPKAYMETGGIRVAFSPEELGVHINAYLQHPEYDREGRKKIAEKFVQFTDGLSWKRTADAIDEIVNKHSK